LTGLLCRGRAGRAKEDPATGTVGEMEAVLRKLPGVQAAHVWGTETAPQIEILIGADQPPRQALQAVISLIHTYFGVAVPPSHVSVVQVRGHGYGPGGRGRVVVLGYGVRFREGIEAHCRLAWGGRTAEGTGRGGSVEQAAALAALGAVSELWPERGAPLGLHGVSVVRHGTLEVAVVTVSLGEAEVLSGSAVVHETVEGAAVRAVLNALNRQMVGEGQQG
jgi:hypothetical protein